MKTPIKIIGLYFSLFCLFGQNSLAQTSPGETNSLPARTILSGEIMNLRGPADTVVLDLKSEFSHGNGGLMIDTFLSQVTKGHHFSFALPLIQKPTYITLRNAVTNYPGLHPTICLQYLIEPGDSVHVVYNENTFDKHFTGRGAEKFNWMAQMAKDGNKLADSLPPCQLGENPSGFFQNTEYTLDYQLKSLERIKGKLSVPAYNILKADVISVYRLTIYQLISYTKFGFGYNNKIGLLIDSIYRTKYLHLAADTIDDKYLKESATYSTYLMVKAAAEFKYRKFHRLQNEHSAYDLIKNTTSDSLSDKVILAYLYNQAGRLLNDSLLNDAYHIVREKKYRDKIELMIKTTGTGNLVQGFSFPDKSGRLVNLESLKGKVILIDMWFTGCHGCIDVAKAMPVVEKAFDGNPGVAFISLSIDKDKERWLASINPKKLVNDSYTHYTSDRATYLFTGGTGGNNEFIRRYNISNSYPCLLLIGRDGRIYSMNPPRPDQQRGQEKLIAEINKALSK
jgi:cytochrome oxidase Cu insertion factor (SCO1/SenC/PrrC family)